jgi:hypothetical protein
VAIFVPMMLMSALDREKIVQKALNAITVAAGPNTLHVIRFAHFVSYFRINLENVF